MWLTPLHPAPPALEVARRLARTPGLAWLDGGLEHGREGRFSFLAAGPCAVLEQRFGEPERAELWDRLERPIDADPRPAGPEDLSPEDVPAWVGHVAYGAYGCPPRERRLTGGSLPGIRFARYDAWVAFDHARRCAHLVGDDEAACARLRRRLAAPTPAAEAFAFTAGSVEAPPRAPHRDAVRAALSLIREGELYEINLARRFRAAFCGSALGLFARMREASPVPFGYFVEGTGHAVLGRSMERFLRFRVRDRALWSSPIKGTIARAGDERAEAERLRSDPKECAEHAMVVDLMRNDLSRVCEIGSVEIGELMAVYPFAGLSHLISTVRGTARPTLRLRELLAHTFPPGSVTGTPKQRVLGAIEQLESAPRGLYTGCVGFVDRAGGCSFAVAIRTAVVADGAVEYFSGGGIVADSDPERETDETDLKAAMFLRALA